MKLAATKGIFTRVLDLLMIDTNIIIHIYCEELTGCYSNKLASNHSLQIPPLTSELCSAYKHILFLLTLPRQPDSCD